MESAGSGIVDFGRFMTGFLVVMGVGTKAFFDTYARLDQDTSYDKQHKKAIVSSLLKGYRLTCIGCLQPSPLY